MSRDGNPTEPATRAGRCSVPVVRLTNRVLPKSAKSPRCRRQTRSNPGKGRKRNSNPPGLQCIAPGHDIPLYIPLKVETRVRIPLGLPKSRERSVPGVRPRDLHADDVDEFLETPEVIGVPCVQGQPGGAGRCRDQEVYGTSTAGLAPFRDDGRIDPPVPRAASPSKGRESKAASAR